ncbi:MAG: GNAT family N-acetyltransferase [Deltaproteobacteria bacterium]|nr:GNAT family N-acetyltransferase [Deltaproteobacteria bacterium]
MSDNGKRNADNGKPARIEIRAMEIGDLPEVYDLGEDLFTAERWRTLYRTWDEYELATLFASEGDLCIVAELDDDIVGFALGTILDKRGSAWVYGHLLWLGVDPKVGRRGVAAKLLERMTETFIVEGARILLVDTAADNEAALAFFRKNGFGDEEPHVYLSKNLTDDPEYKAHRKREKLRDAAARRRARKLRMQKRAGKPAEG